MIEFSHAISDPGAVMVHSEDAFPADAAVMHPWFLHKVALRAIPNTVQRFDFLPA